MNKDSIQNKLKGKVNQATGVSREKLGDITGNEEMERKGRAQRVKGDSQDALGKAQDAASSATEAAKDAIEDLADKTKDAVGR